MDKVLPKKFWTKQRIIVITRDDAGGHADESTA